MQIVAPFTGSMNQTGETQVTIIVKNLKDTKVIIDNIKIDGKAIGQLVKFITRRKTAFNRVQGNSLKV